MLARSHSIGGSAMHGKVMTYDEWKKLTDVVGKPRSKELKEVDEALKRLERFGGGDALWRLQQALDAWKQSQGPGDAWKRSVRNKKLAVEQLTAQISGLGDTSAAWGHAPQFMQSTLEHARLGVVYLLGKLRARADMFSVVLEGGLSVVGNVLCYHGGKVADGGLGNQAVDFGQNIFNTVMVPGNMILNAANSAALDVHVDSEKRSLAEKIRQVFEDFIRKTLQVIKEKIGDTELTYAAFKNLGLLCSKLFMETLGAGLISGMTDTFRGIAVLETAVVERFRTYLMSRGVHVMVGHPSVVVESIKRAMNLSILQGLWQTLKGAGNIALAFATWGQSMIVGLVLACFEFLVKTIWRIVELVRMNRTFHQAARYWASRNSPDALHKQPFAFYRWYRERALHLPAIAVLTLNSGICGDKMVYLSMFNDHDVPITSQEFLRGASYLDHLKVWGVDYLDKCGYSFYSSDPFVAAILDHAKSHKRILTREDKVLSEVTKFATA
jgi:hypothetical protein